MNGRSLRRLTDNDVFDADIAWAPNGRSLAYKSYRDGNDEIYLLTLDGEDLANLTMDPSSDFQSNFTGAVCCTAFAARNRASVSR